MSDYPERYVVFDTETLSRAANRKHWHKEQWLRLGMAKVYDPVAVIGNKPLYHGFTTAGEFQGLIRSMPVSTKPVYVFAHNLGFDLRIVDWLRALSNKEFSLLPPPDWPGAKRYKKRLFVVDAYPCMIRLWRPDGQQFVLIDSFNWLNARLAVIGDWLRYPKAPMPPANAPDADWFEYCQRDVDVLDRALRRLWGWMQSVRIPNFSYTPASVAAQVYRMRYAKKRIVRPADIELLKLDRLGYIGGRIDAFRVGYIEGTTYELDVNSLYPKVMLDHVYPCEVLDHGNAEGGIPDEISGSPQVFTAEVLIDSPELSWPVRGRDATLFVRGRVRAILCGPELKRAFECGCIRGVYRWNKYQCIDLFSEFVRTFWRHRAQAQIREDDLVDKACKGILNSLHGKFGQRDGEWVHQGRTSIDCGYGTGRVIGRHVRDDVEYRVMDGELFYRCRDQEHEQAFVPIAAWTASYARMYMYELMRIAGPKHVHYLCIDSLLVDGEGLGALQLADKVDERKLGMLKHEDTFKWVDIKAHNQITHDHGWKLSGIKKDAKEIGHELYEFEEWSSTADDVHAGHVSSVATRVVQRKPSTRYYQRHRNLDGTTTAWAIDNWAVTPEEMRDLDVLSYRYRSE